MPRTRSRPGTSSSVSTSNSLMQDVPGSFPMSNNEEYEDTVPLSLSQAVAARKAEFVKPKHVRIKVGTWNVAGCKGTEKDIGAWFVEGKGVSEALAGLRVNDKTAVPDDREDSAAQEARYTPDEPTVPEGDPGTLPGNNDVGLYVLGLQEMVDISSVTEAIKPYNDPSVANKWKQSVTEALPEGYQLVAEQQLIGLMLMIFATPEVAKEVRSVSTTSVGTGLGGFMGNKGAVTARIVLGDTTRLVFVNCHLAAGADKTSLERRNWDAGQIIARTRFDPIQDAMDLQQTTGEQIGEEDFTFWVGDLNYRLEGIPGDDVRRLLMLHTRNEYDLSQKSAKKVKSELESATESIKKRREPDQFSIGSTGSVSPSPRSSMDAGADTESTAPTVMEEIDASEDPTSLQTTLSSLLPHDELQQQMSARKAFYDGWREGPITFLPTYKYDKGSVGVFDSSEKKRGPSWCDRILYRTRRDRLAYEAKVKEEENAKKKDAEMKANGLDMAASDEDILYDYDPETDGAEQNDEYDEYDEYDDVDGDDVVLTKEGYEDELSLEYYTAHQRILSSDHKPLNAIFMLKYDAVVPELKARVYAEVAKNFDKVENESRPDVTVVVDKHGDKDCDKSDSDLSNFEGVWFGDVRWAQSKHRTLTIANTGRVGASFSLIERPVANNQSSGIAPSWLNLKILDNDVASSSSSTNTIYLEPGDATIVELEIRVFDLRFVSGLNDGNENLDDVLLLRVEGGRDHFIPVRAKWLDTTLGRSIDKLTRIPEGGIRKLQGQRPDSSSSKSGASSKGLTTFDEEPVRFSAPRELFKLTEAIEGLSARVVAEWDMIHPSDSSTAEPEIAPWRDYPGWPFEKQCWTERTTSQWEDALGEVCHALDCDQSVEPSLPATLPRMQQLYVLCDLLLRFLETMPDGIITSSLWSQIDSRLTDNEKSKRKSIGGDNKTAIQEILSQEPSHNICFIMITSMIDRILMDIASTSSGSGSNEKPIEDAQLSPTRKAAGTLKRVANLGKLPAAPEREQSSIIMARIFAAAMIRVAPGGGDKIRLLQEKRRVDVVEMFIKRDD